MCRSSSVFLNFSKSTPFAGSAGRTGHGFEEEKNSDSVTDLGKCAHHTPVYLYKENFTHFLAQPGVPTV